MDEFSFLLNSSSIGGQIGRTFLNHDLCYADDLCLISLSSSGMHYAIVIEPMFKAFCDMLIL